MLKLLCILLSVIGAAIHAVNLYHYHKTLKSMRRQTYETSVIKHWVYWVFFHVLLLLFLSYLVEIWIVARQEFRPSSLLIGTIFLLFSLFVFYMVRSTHKMVKKISQNPFEVIHALITSIEAKDKYTMGHSRHVMQLCELICEALPEETRSKINLQMLKDAALLHDIGKLRIPDRILQKPGSLDGEETILIQQHPKFGYDMLHQSSSFSHISKWVLYHHERADGCGYYGIPAHEVPVESKIIAVADTYSALSTDRSYHSRLDYSQAVRIMMDAAGTQLDAGLVDVFCSIDRETIDSIAPRFDLEISFIDVQALRQAVRITDQLGGDITMGGTL